MDLEVLRNNTRVEEPIYVSISVEDQPYAGEVLDLSFNGR
jgi:hypothetical protein